VNALAGIENPKEFVQFAQSGDKVKILKAQSSRIAELEEALRNLTDEFSKPDYELFCDHNAGICSCRPLELIEKAKQLLNK
jgi:hypothetical protein